MNKLEVVEVVVEGRIPKLQHALVKCNRNASNALLDLCGSIFESNIHLLFFPHILP